ncbi:hypothetical protein [Roseateles terrae]|uniref:Uncharacterized protein n=1 Tax=Roseateles terrae TaxID=431060 RepID=A0ABR6GQG7_9BURK|nr:hypothetical protein [Roseateles terrae]MBB3194360.1 hypothetical protein [Roseateles terrae]OWQ88194.1 hypothetical protein CDN98_08690 [Roseateles terrae]
MYPVSGCPTGSATAQAQVDPPPATLQPPPAGPADRDAFLHQLCNPRHRFSGEDNKTICQWLPTVLTRCKKWPLGCTVQWEEPSTSGADRSARPGQGILRVREGVSPQVGMPAEGLFVRWDVVQGERAPRLLPERFIRAPDDIFDAAARSTKEYWLTFTAARTYAAENDGMPLRRELADWLQTPEGSRHPVPVLTGASTPQARSLPQQGPEPAPQQATQQLQPLMQPPMQPHVPRLVQPLVPLQVAPPGALRWLSLPPSQPVQPPGQTVAVTPWRDLRTVSREEVEAAVAEAVNDRAAAAGALLRAAPLRPPADPLLAAIRTLREGGWTEALSHLVSSVVVRLPPNHLMHVDALRVHHADGSTDYGTLMPAATRYFIRQQMDGSYLHYCTHQQPQQKSFTPDAFLELIRSRFSTTAPLSLAAIRKELADVIALNPEAMRLRLALCERGWPLDQELLMRLCMVNRALTVAGQQVMDPALPQRPVRVSDLMRWFRPLESALARRPNVIAAEGISVIDAHLHATPERPTAKGRQLLREGDAGMTTFPSQPHESQLLNERFAELLYAYRTTPQLMTYLGGNRRQLPAMLSIRLEEQMAANQFAATARAAEQLAVPPMSPFVRTLQP